MILDLKLRNIYVENAFNGLLSADMIEGSLASEQLESKHS